MPEEPNPNVPPAPPPEPPPPPPPEVEAVDADGVPYKNRAAEFQRKYEESERAKEALLQAIQNRNAPPAPEPAKAGIDDILKQYKPEDQTALRALYQAAVTEAEQRARNVGYSLMTKVSLQSLIQQNPAIKAEAEKIYPTLKANPFWANISDEQLEAMAIQQAAAAVQARQPGSPAPQPVNLPQNRGGGQPPAAGDPKEKFIKDWMANEENRGVFQQMYRGKLTLESDAGQKALREAAEIAYQEGQKPLPFFGPNSVVGRAATSILNQAKGNV